MGNNLPPGVSVSDLPGNNVDVPDKAPFCKRCDREGTNPWQVTVRGKMKGENEVADCENHGILPDNEWDMRKI